MFLSHMALPRSALAAGLTCLLLAPGFARAQYLTGPRIPPDAKGYQTTLIVQEHMKRQAAQRAAASRPPTVRSAPSRPKATTGAVQVVISSLQAPPVYVDVRGPDGRVRRFPVKGGRQTIQVRPIVVRPGEAVTIHIPSPTR